jgi:ADP-ribosylglycohydrolase
MQGHGNMKATIGVIICAALLFSCLNKVVDDEAQLMALHRQQREAHFSKNASAIVNQLADNFLSVSHCRIDSLNRENDTKGFERYFHSVDFRKWDDLNPPAIRFSDDRTMAYMVVDKIVELEALDSAGNKIVESTHFAWVAICKKQESGDWKIECVASTNEPSAIKDL